MEKMAWNEECKNLARPTKDTFDKVYGCCKLILVFLAIIWLIIMLIMIFPMMKMIPMVSNYLIITSIFDCG